MVQLGPDYDLAVRLKRLEDQMARLQGSPYGAAFSASQSDGSVGLQIYQDPITGTSSLVFRQGPATAFSDTTDTSSGLPQHPKFVSLGQLNSADLPTLATLDKDAGMAVLREDGSAMLILTSTGGVQFFDKQGNLLYATAEREGAGQAWPPVYYPLPVSNGNTNDLVTTITTVQEVGTVGFYLTTPWFLWEALLRGNGSCYIELENFDTAEKIDLPTSGAGFANVAQSYAMPVSWVNHWVTATIYASATTGGSAFTVIPMSLYGFGSPPPTTNSFYAPDPSAPPS